MVYCIPACHDDIGIIENLDAAFAELDGVDGLQLYEGAEVNLEIEFLGEIEIGRFLGFGLRLSNKNPLY
jgi:hypothetical protein